MSRYRVLVTDYAWPDLDVEQHILSEVQAELVISPNAQQLVDLAADVDAIMACWETVSRPVITAARNCRLVARYGIGLDNIDVAACTERGILVTNVPDYCLAEVAEHTLALLLSLARKTAWYHCETKRGKYDRQSPGTIRRIEGQTLGIVGLGNIGRRVARAGQAIGMQVIAHSRRHSPATEGVPYSPLDELLAHSDFVSLHLPLTTETKHLIGAPQLARMKPTAYLINTARGGLIDHQALAAALAANQIAGAALDVQSPEPPDLSQPPFNDPRVLVTPHAAFVSAEATTALRSRTARQVADLLRGIVPEHVVNPEVLHSFG